MDSGIATGTLQGTPTKEPAFGLDAWWIDPSLTSRAESMNYTVVGPSSVVATHITEVVKKHGEELLTREEVANIVEGAKAKAPRLIEEVIPGVVKLGELQRVLQNLLRERVPVRDIETIIETLGDWAPKTKDLDVLTEYTRHALRRAICEQHSSPGEHGTPRMACVTLDPALEDQINAYVDRGAAGTTVTMPARVAQSLSAPIVDGLGRLTVAGHPPVVIASPQVRAVVHQMLESRVPGVAVLAYNEIVSGIEVESLALISPPAPNTARPQAVGAA
jgi:flagellar biosynthesis protein FlhA